MNYYQGDRKFPPIEGGYDITKQYNMKAFLAVRDPNEPIHIELPSDYITPPKLSMLKRIWKKIVEFIEHH